MKELAKRLKLDRWIEEGAPAFWVLGISAMILGAILGILAALSVTFDWAVLRVAISWVLCALVACIVGLILWFVVDALIVKECSIIWRK